MDGWIRYHLQVMCTEEGRPSPVQGQLSPVEAKRDDSFAAPATQVIPYQVGGIAVKRGAHQSFAVSKPLIQTKSFYVRLFRNRDLQDSRICCIRVPCYSQTHRLSHTCVARTASPGQRLFSVSVYKAEHGLRPWPKSIACSVNLRNSAQNLAQAVLQLLGISVPDMPCWFGYKGYPKSK